MADDKREYLFKLLNENRQLKEEIEQLKKRVHELEPTGRWIRYRVPEYFSIRIAEEMARASRYKYEFAILLGELDNLDVFSKRHGEEAVAELLGMLEIVIQDSLRNTDLRCYFGDGKFGAVLPYTNCEGALGAAGKIRQAVERLFALKSHSSNIKLTISIGVACYPGDAVQPENLLSRAREAYAHARTSGNSIFAAAEQDKLPAAEPEAEVKLMQNDSFLSALDDEISRCSRYGLKFALMVLAVTDLENDRNRMDGAARAKIMRAVFQKLAAAIRTVDRCYLYTDSRFALVLPSTSADGGKVLAQKLIAGLTLTPVYKLEGKELCISINMGITVFPGDDVARDGLLRKVEAALNHAIGKGSNRYSLAAEILSSPEQGQRDIDEWIAMLKDGGQKAVFNLLAVLDMTERYEPAHSQSVARHAMSIGKMMGMTSVALQRLRVMAMLHDLGKICIPPAIITKPGPLRDDEWEAMLKHPQYGAAILEQLPDLAYCCIPILSHHEMWDGKGYPHGLKGDTIPLESRIIAVAEAFDDMVSPRPYRSLVTLNDAMSELRNKADAQFDPAVVESFFKTLPGRTGHGPGR